MNQALIAFGANLANPRETLMDAVGALGEAGVVIDALSPLYRSPAWPPGSDAPDYLNAVMRVRARREPAELLALLLDIEAQLGRVRGEPNAPRLIDLDLLDYAGQRSDDPAVRLPHPRMTDRAFVLLPLRDVAPDWRHPDGLSVAELLAAVDTADTTRA